MSAVLLLKGLCYVIRLLVILVMRLLQMVLKHTIIVENTYLWYNILLNVLEAWGDFPVGNVPYITNYDLPPVLQCHNAKRVVRFECVMKLAQ